MTILYFIFIFINKLADLGCIPVYETEKKKLDVREESTENYTENLHVSVERKYQDVRRFSVVSPVSDELEDFVV